MVLHNLCVDARCKDHAPPAEARVGHVQRVWEAAAANASYVNATHATYGIDNQGAVERESATNTIHMHKACSSHSMKRDELCARRARVKAVNLKRPAHSTYTHS